MTAPRTVSEATVMRMLYALGAALEWRGSYPETARAIAKAANDHPLMPEHAEGSELAVCLLVASAWDASRFDPYGSAGRRVGLFRLVPPTDPKPKPNVLILPRSAALIALDLIRTSQSICSDMPWDERLVWYLDLGTEHRAPSEHGLRQSRRVLRHARALFLRYFRLTSDDPRLASGSPYELPAACPTEERCA